jgi:hypothetical protein
MEVEEITITKTIITLVKGERFSQRRLCRGVISQKIEFEIGKSDFRAWILNRVMPNNGRGLNQDFKVNTKLKN